MVVKRKKKVKKTKSEKALARNVKRRKNPYATHRDQELMFGY